MTETSSFTVAVCTRGRPEKVRAALDALWRQEGAEFPILVVEQSRSPDPELARRAAGERRLTVIPDDGAGLSRARNLALRAASTEWIAFVDDDCLVEPGFARALAEELSAHPEADWVSGDVAEDGPPRADYVPVTTFPVREACRLQGRWTLPGSIGFGVFFAVRRAIAERLGGWDERLGPGVPDFPAADDMDFNHRLLRAGGTAWVTPRVRVRHEQWRPVRELPRLHRGYLAAWSGFSMKQLRTGEPLAGLWLWAWGALDVLHMLGSAVRHRSRLRLRLAAAKLSGLVRGTVRGALRRW
jgi:GT2 family glycosyltransferase